MIQFISQKIFPKTNGKFLRLDVNYGWSDIVCDISWYLHCLEVKTIGGFPFFIERYSSHVLSLVKITHEKTFAKDNSSNNNFNILKGDPDFIKKLLQHMYTYSKSSESKYSKLIEEYHELVKNKRNDRLRKKITMDSSKDEISKLRYQEKMDKFNLERSYDIFKDDFEDFLAHLESKMILKDLGVCDDCISDSSLNNTKNKKLLKEFEYELPMYFD